MKDPRTDPDFINMRNALTQYLTGIVQTENPELLLRTTDHIAEICESVEECALDIVLQHHRDQISAKLQQYRDQAA